MFNRLSISTRFALGTALLVAIVVPAISTFTVMRMQATLGAAEELQLEQVHTTVLAELDAEGRRGESLSALVAGIPAVQQAFAAGDRDALRQMFERGFAHLKKSYGIRQFHFHLPPAVSFLRMHKPEQFGDDMSAERLTVVRINRTQAPVRGLETGVGGLGIRGMVPVSLDGKHIGSVEFGMAFDQTFFDQFKAAHGIDLALRLKRGGEFETFGSTLGPIRALTADQEQQVFEGRKLSFPTVLNGRPYAVYADVVKDFSGKPIGVLEIAADRSFFAAAVGNMRNVILGIGALAMVGGVLFAFLMSRGICRALQLAAKSMEDIAAGEGDLTIRLREEGQDEVAHLAHGFNRFVERIHNMVEEVACGAGKLANVVGQLSSAAENTHRGMVRQRSETEQIAAAMNEMSATVHEVANNTSLAASAAAEAGTQARKGGQVVQRSIDSIRGVADEVDHVAAAITRVNTHSTDIGGVLEVISSIAEQTNLLALNAAIEAARAGDQGRGFAVVADEVRVLAQRTQHSTGEIHSMIARLQSGAQEAVQMMERSRERTQESVGQAGAAGDALAVIAKSVDIINQMNTQIATASEEQTAVADEINRNIARISEVSEQAAQTSSETAAYGEQLVQLAEELLKLVHLFRLGERDLEHDLDRAKTAHLAWRVRLRSFLDGRQTLDGAQAVSDHECAFGKWYFGEGGAQFGHLAAMRAVAAPHAEMHRLIKEVIALKQAHKLAEAEQEYAKVEPLSREIVELIEEIKAEALRSRAAPGVRTG